MIKHLVTYSSITIAIVLALWPITPVLSLPSDQALVKDVAPGDLIAEWQMEEGAGTILGDSSGNGHDGTIYNATWTTEGKIAGGLSFDGDGDYVAIWSQAEINANVDTSNGAIAAWFKPDNTGFVYQYFSNNNDRLYLSTENGKYHIGLGNRMISTDADAQMGIWQHVVVTWNSAGTLRVYVNGELDTTSTYTPGFSFYGAAENFYLGRGWESNKNWYQGVVDEIAIYDRALTAREVLEVYLEADLIAKWKMDEGIGTDMIDSSRNGHNGLITNATWTTGRFSNGLSFDGDGDYVAIWSQAEIDATVDTSHGAIAAWFKPDNTGFVYQYFSNNDDRLYLSTENGKYHIGLGNRMISTNADAQMGVWQHVVVTWSSDGTLKVYVNGELDTTSTYTPGFSFHGSAENFYLGRGWGGNENWYQGAIDEVAIYGRALTASETSGLYESLVYLPLVLRN